MKNLKSAICLAAVFAMATVASAQTEPGSFINSLCATTSTLVSHVKTTPKVMDRYTRHFAMTESEVVNYLGALSVSKTDDDGLYVVYGAPVSGVIRSRLIKIKKGTRVWVDQAGEVVLLWHCGNPVTRGPKIPHDVNKPVASASGTPVDQLREVPLQSPTATMQANVSVFGEPSVPDVPSVPGEPIIPQGNRDIPIVMGNSNYGLLGILPALAIVTNTGGPNAVPEPATMAILAIGGAGVMMRRRKKK